MNQILIDIVAGTRPNFVKIGPIIKAIKKLQNRGELIKFRLIHTGQHYDESMSDVFFEQLNLPKPDINLEVGSGSQASQTGSIMVRYEAVLDAAISDFCIVVGDVNSTMACAVTAKKKGVKVVHVEAGIRSNDWNMPEEINRVVTDSITDWFFTTSEFANRNLELCGIPGDRIFFVGNTMIETLLDNIEKLKKPSFWNEYALENENYFVLTMHRPGNVDEIEKLKNILNAVSLSASGYKIIFPAHPRTEKVLRENEISPSNIIFVPPQSYLEFNYLLKHCVGVITDSGGITEEATILNIPCITLRENTERPETVFYGSNELVGSCSNKIEKSIKCIVEGGWKNSNAPKYWDGEVSERIFNGLLKILHQ